VKGITAIVAFLGFVARAQTSSSQHFMNETGIEFVRIEPGEMQVAVFEPSCPNESDFPSDVAPQFRWAASDYSFCEALVRRALSPGFRVTIGRAFYIGKYEITQAQFLAVMGRNPSRFQGANIAGDASRHPVEQVSWDDAQAFARELNAREKTHAYRLPTEFEWEYAGRAGGRGQVDWDVVRRQAVQGLRAKPGEPTPTTSPVGSREPNAWGLYDMLGNVWEWVQDLYNEKTFPDRTPPVSGAQHVLKGAGFLSDVKNAIYAAHAAGPGDGWDVGFRIVKDIDPGIGR
jgi:sulfatase modifying factor 1